MSERKIIGVCTSGVSTEYNDVICNGIINHAKNYDNVKIMFYQSFLNRFDNTSHDTGENSVFNLINFEKIDGLIILAQTIKDTNIIDKLVNDAKSHNIPVVCFDYERSDCLDIHFDGSRAVYQLTSHLIEAHRCSKINFMAGYKRDIMSIIRSNAYMKALSEHGLPVERSRIGEGYWWTFTAEEACKKWILEGKPFDAVVCANDLMAISVMKVLREYSINVPEDVKVVGIDNLAEGVFHNPAITTADFCHAEAVKDALDMVLGIKLEKHLVKYPKLLFKESCGCQSHCENVKMNDLHREMYTSVDAIVFNNVNMYNLTSKIIEQNDTQRAFEYLENFLWELWATKIWVCVNKDFIEERMDFEQDFDEVRALQKDYGEYVRVVGSKNSSSKDAGKVILTSELCPNFDEMIDECKSMIVFPLHINDNIFGYIIKEHSSNFDMEKWHSLTMNLSTSLLALKQQNDMKLANRRLEEMNMRDSMTKVYNRRGFFHYMKKYMAYSYRKKMIVISIDLDDLKKINDSYGHLEGDSAITVTAQTLVKSLGEEQICARFGGDEFIVSGLYDEKYDFSQKFTKLLDEYNKNSNKPYEIKASIGYVVRDCEEYCDFDELLRLADEKMYVSKTTNHRGRKRENPD